MKHYFSTPEGKAAKARAQAKYAPAKRQPCEQCGTPTEAVVCWTCAKANATLARKRQAIKRRIERAARGSSSRAMITSGRCHYCGDSFTTRSPTAVRFCSVRCKHLDHAARRRARAFDVWVAEVNRSAVFRQHGWHCYLCDSPIDPGLPLNDPMSATLDHVIPLIGKGPHCEANLRPAHMMCNSIKSLDEAGTPIIAA